MRAWGQNLGQCAARTIDFRDDGFTGQRIGDKDRAIRALRDALAARSEPVDGEPRHHCENWLPVFGRNRAADVSARLSIHGAEKGMRVIVNVNGARSTFPCDRIGRRPRRKQCRLLALAAPLRATLYRASHGSYC